MAMVGLGRPAILVHIVFRGQLDGLLGTIVLLACIGANRRIICPTVAILNHG